MIGVVTKGAGDAWEWEWVGVDSGGAHLLATSAPLYLSEAQALANGMVILSQCRDWPVESLTEV
mgnify:CR=1